MSGSSQRRIKNWKVIWLALLISIVFWFFNELNKEHNTRLYYPIQFDFPRDSIVVMKPLEKTILIDVTSGGWVLLRHTFFFNPKPVIINILKPTELKFIERASLLPEVSDQLNELKVNYMITDSLFFDLEDRISKKFSVSIDSIQVPLATEYRITSNIQIDSDSIEIIGAKRILSGLTSPIYLIIKEREIDEDFDDEVFIPLTRPDITTVIPEKINVKFDVARFTVKESLAKIELINFPSDSSVFIDSDSILVTYTLKGDDPDRYTSNDFNLVFDYESMNTEDSTIFPSLIDFPEDAIEIYYKPERLKIVQSFEGQ